MRVLVVEDERRLAVLLHQGLTEGGHDVALSHTGLDGLAEALTGTFDAIVLDRMLPGMDGLDVCRALRADGLTVPVLLLTARGSVPDRVAGLDAGADDYLVKPFAIEELLARLRALNRRAASESGPLRAGDLALDADSRTVRRAGTEIPLTAREFEVLKLLMERAGKCVTRYEILDRVWDGDTDLRSNVIDVYIASLRAKVDRPFGRTALRTLRGAGYTLAPDGG